MADTNLKSLLSVHDAVRLVFTTDGRGAFVERVGELDRDDLAPDMDVLAGVVESFAARNLGHSKVFVVLCEEGLVIGRQLADGKGVLGAVAQDVTALGLLVHHISNKWQEGVDS